MPAVSKVGVLQPGGDELGQPPFSSAFGMGLEKGGRENLGFGGSRLTAEP